jgi:hypothetical protein
LLLITEEIIEALRHAQTLFGQSQPPAEVPPFPPRRNPVRQVQRTWRQHHPQTRHQPTTLAAAHQAAPKDKAGIARYIYEAARAHGLSDHDATALVAYSIGESGLNPTISGGVQGDAEVIGLFQEKPGFAIAGGETPAARYTVEGNTAAYLHQLDAHPGGDIFQRLLHTSVGGPMYTGGYRAMQSLMTQARELLGVQAV